MHIGDKFGYPKRKKVPPTDKKKLPDGEAIKNQGLPKGFSNNEIELNDSSVDNSRKQLIPMNPLKKLPRKPLDLSSDEDPED